MGRPFQTILTSPITLAHFARREPRLAYFRAASGNHWNPVVWMAWLHFSITFSLGLDEDYLEKK